MAQDVRRETLLEILRGGTYPVPGPLVNFRPLKLHRVVEDVNRKHGDVTAVRPRNFDPRATWDEMSTELRSTRSLRGLSPRAQRQAPWVLFYPLPKLPILGQDPELVRALLNLFESRQRPSPVIALMHCFLRDYPEEWGTFESLRTGIRKLLKARPDRRAKTRERADRYFLLEPKGPGKLAKDIMGSSAPIGQTMEEACLVGELEAGKFSENCFCEMIEIVHDKLAEGQMGAGELGRFFEFAEGKDGLRFGNLKVVLANSLLEPFGSQDPPPNIAAVIQKFLLRHLHDPRLSPGGWVGVSDLAREVMFRWLVGATLEDFFQVLDRTAPGTQQGTRWLFRKAFWGGYYRKGLIRDAWIALGQDAQYLVRRSGSGQVLRYASLEGATSVDCLLLLRIGNLTIAEWSHTGMCRFWVSANKSKPAFYKATYTKEMIYSSDPNKATRHDGAASGSWQYDFADYIASHTNARLSSSDYMPKGR